jgi:hypothetical protein
VNSFSGTSVPSTLTHVAKPLCPSIIVTVLMVIALFGKNLVYAFDGARSSCSRLS